ncbi:MAG TPA: 2-amino-4-hydroxy-6-hydroxymethyldihydropteridine diphosphokinase [Thermodesulfobacteriota bacterium]|jgi:2-amino-4-hydroxy-6-hydroxymethyldihydropteridine diphosphokinase|nr:2-amino-4-hydroxy-6-hydroxymethyldihydropteridine diphosphokinase [Thermodesulfobacteriota bacterium]
MAVAFIGIGSNLGNRVENCLNAIKEIGSLTDILAVSSLYETEPVGREDQPDFINCVIKVETGLSPSDLLISLKYVEEKLGGRRGERWGPRVIDLDVIFYDDLVIETDWLTLPHPRAHLRRFVLLPLCEIAPDLVHPTLKVSVSGLLDGLKDKKRVSRIGNISTAYSHKSTVYPQD